MGLKIVERRGPLGGLTTKGRYEVPLVPGEPLHYYVPEEYRALEVCIVRLNGEPVDDDQLNTIRPRDGDEMTLVPVAGAGLIVSAVLFVIGIALKIGEYHWNKHEAKMRRHAKRRAEVGPTYAFDIMQNVAEDGASVPVIMGKHRGGGVILQEFTDSVDEGRDRHNILIAAGEGPIESISDIHINGNPSANYSAVEDTELGTNDQAGPDLFNAEVETTPLNSQLLENTPVIMYGTTPADRWGVKITFVEGLYKEEHDGSYGSLDFTFNVRYRLTSGPGSWSSPIGYDYKRRRMTPFSIWFYGNLPTTDTYDIEVTRTCGNSQGRYHYDAYWKEQYEILFANLRHPNLALVGVRSVATEQLSGRVERITALYEGILVNTMSSASLMGAPAYTRKPAELMLGLLYNPRWGLLNDIDPGFELTMTSTSLDYTVGEIVEATSPASDYPFKGIVRSWNGTTRKLILDSLRGLPYGTLTGASSGKAADVSSIDECYQCDLASFWSLREWNREQVYDRKDATFVNHDSPASGTKIYVPTNAGWSNGDNVLVGYGTAREESQVVSGTGTDGTGPYIATVSGLTYTHTQLQADSVIHEDNTEDRHTFNFIFDGAESGWDALERIARCAQAALAPVRGGYLYVVPLKAQTPVQLVNMGNVKSLGFGATRKSSFKVEFPDVTGRPNRLVADYMDEDHDYKAYKASVDLPEAYDNGDPVVSSYIEMFGCTSRRQTEDVLWYRLKRLHYGGRPIEFQMGLEFVDFVVGDCIWVQHDVPGLGVGGGRVVGAGSNYVDVDHPVEVSGGETVRVRHQDDTQETATLAATAGKLKRLYITGTWTQTPAANDLWAVGDLGVYMVIAMEFTQDLQAVVQAEEVADELYDPNPYVVPSFTPSTLPDPDEMPPDVEGITLTEGTQLRAGLGALPFIDVAWIKPEHNSYSHAEIWLRDISEQVIETGAPGWAPNSNDGEFIYPTGLAVYGDYVYVANRDNARVEKLKASDLTFSAKSSYAFKTPVGIATDGTYVYVIDGALHQVVTLLASDLSFVAVFGTKGTGNGEFDSPQGAATDGYCLWVCDTMNHRVQRFSLTAGVLTYDAQVGSYGTGDSNFDRPFGIDIDSTPTYMFVVDNQNHRVKKHYAMSTMGYVSQFGSQGTGDSQFQYPCDVAVNDDGSVIVVADYLNHVVKTYDDTYTHLNTFGVTGTWGVGPDLFNLPRGLAHDKDETIFVSEYGNHRVQSRKTELVDGDDWVYCGRSEYTTFRIADGITAGKKMEVAVVSVSRTGVKKLPGDAPSETLTTVSSTDTPPNVVDFYAVRVGFQVRLYWNAVIAWNLRGYEVRAGTDWDTGRPVAQNIDGVEVLVAGAPVSGTTSRYWIKAVTTATPPQYSPTAKSVDIDTPWVGVLASTYIPTIAGTNLRTST